MSCVSMGISMCTEWACRLIVLIDSEACTITKQSAYPTVQKSTGELTKPILNCSNRMARSVEMAVSLTCGLQEQSTSAAARRWCPRAVAPPHRPSLLALTRAHSPRSSPPTTHPIRPETLRRLRPPISKHRPPPCASLPLRGEPLTPIRSPAPCSLLPREHIHWALHARDLPMLNS
jgi:hypothetical protein